MTRAPVRLLATTREVDPSTPLDIASSRGFAWLHHRDDEHVQLVTHGVVARLAPDDVHAALHDVVTDDPLALPGTGAIAVGALPFAPDSPGALVVPTTVVGRGHGRAWITEIGPAEEREADSPPAPSRFSVVAPRNRDAWRAAVDQALEEIAHGTLEKVVLAREVLVEADTEFDLREVLTRLVAQQLGSFVYAAAGLVGASPELLARRVGTHVESRPVAGTIVADGDAAALDELAASVKDNLEHRFVADAISDALGDVCTDLEVAATPEVAVFGPVAHLATPITGTLRSPAPTALELARLLHPTPAVGGVPRAAALSTIERLEGFDRGRYAGPVGWVDARGDGEWAIALRCAELDGARARLVAGAGIVAGSDPEAEWAETQAKLEPMLRALVRP